MTVRQVLALATAAVLLAGGCADTRSGSLGPAPTPAPPAQPSLTPGTATPTGAGATAQGSAAPDRPTRTGGPATDATARPAGTITIELWFSRAGRLAPTRRSRPATLATSRLALTELVAGPTLAERRAGLYTGLSSGFTVDTISDRVATVAFGPAFYAGSAAAARLRQAQVVYTLTQFPTVDRVRFLSGGKATGPPAGRTEYADLLPPIVVLDPVIGRRVTSPITVTGTADVFEATVTGRVLDHSGRQIATAFTTATCGSGCRGEYRLTLPYRSAGGAATVEIYQVSPKDGTRRDVVAVPVTLGASP
jgi:hypothetical protein